MVEGDARNCIGMVVQFNCNLLSNHIIDHHFALNGANCDTFRIRWEFNWCWRWIELGICKCDIGWLELKWKVKNLREQCDSLPIPKVQLNGLDKLIGATIINHCHVWYVNGAGNVQPVWTEIAWCHNTQEIHREKKHDFLVQDTLLPKELECSN